MRILVQLLLTTILGYTLYPSCCGSDEEQTRTTAGDATE